METGAVSLTTRLTVEIDTPASRATSEIVGLCFARLPDVVNTVCYANKCSENTFKAFTSKKKNRPANLGNLRQ